MGLMTPWIGFAQIAKYTIKINAPHFTDGTNISLKIGHGINNSTILKKGKAIFNGTISNPSLITIAIDTADNPKKILLYFVYGEVDVDLNGDQVSIARNEFATDYYYKLLLPVRAYNSKVNELWASADYKPDSATQNKAKELIAACFRVPKDYIKTHPASPVSIQALIMMRDGTDAYPVKVPELESLYNSLTSTIRNSENGKAYAANLANWRTRDAAIKN